MGAGGFWCAGPAEHSGSFYPMLGHRASRGSRKEGSWTSTPVNVGPWPQPDSPHSLSGAPDLTCHCRPVPSHCFHTAFPLLVLHPWVTPSQGSDNELSSPNCPKGSSCAPLPGDPPPQPHAFPASSAGFRLASGQKIYNLTALWGWVSPQPGTAPEGACRSTVPGSGTLSF